MKKKRNGRKKSGFKYNWKQRHLCENNCWINIKSQKIVGSKKTNDNKIVIRWTYSQDMEVQIPVQISLQLRDPKRILHKDSIIYIHFMKGRWY